MIEVQNLSKSFGTKQVFKDLSVDFKEKEISFVLGKSGVGKSVLLKHLIGLLSPDSGKVVIDGQEIHGLSEHELTSIRKKCGMVFQFPALLDSLTVRENIAFGIYAHGLAKVPSEVDERVLKMLGYVGLTPKLLDQYPPELSFGLQKRVAIARTLAIEPEYLLFDEPTTGLDPVTTHTLNDLILKLRNELKVSAIVVSHDIESAFSISDRILLLEDARLVFEGTSSEFRSSTHPVAQAFVKEGTHYA